VKTSPAIKDRNGDRRRIVAYLAEHGATPGDQLAEKLGLTLAQFWPLINCPWFDIMTGGWGLTDRGRTEGLGAPETPPAPTPSTTK
jgi:hypothetical protein